MSQGERERAAEPGRVPFDMGSLIAGRAWSRDLVGMTGCAVHRLHKDDAPDLYLKHGRGAATDEVTDEMVRLRWLRGRLEAPELVAFSAAADEAWMLSAALPGLTAYQALEADPVGRGALVEALARFLRRLHALPLDACPFDSGPRIRMAAARRRVEAGLVETDEFDEARAGWTAGQVWDELLRLDGFPVDPGVTHGDFSLDNILVAEGEVVGCIDVGRLGVADRWQDLAILWNCLGEFDASLQTALLEAYGAELDERKLQFHLVLDELF